MPTFVIAGANAAGGTAAATLREEGFDGRVVLIGDDPNPPYERPPLSKEFLRGEQDLPKGFIRPPEFYAGHDIETHFGRRVRRVDPHARSVLLEGGDAIGYDALLLATGVRNRRLGVPGADLDGVFDLRTAADAERIRFATAGATRAVIVGFGFIGAEVAASMRQMGLGVTVVEPLPGPLHRVVGPQFGRVIEALHRDHGVEMIFEDSAARFEGRGRFEALVTERGRRLEGDLAVVGVGTEPNDELAAGAGIARGNGVLVNASLRTEAPGVFAAGDVARHDHPLFGRIRVEHLDNAEKMGAAAARAMMGSDAPFEDPHWFWSDQYDTTIQMGGFTIEWRDPVIRGSLEERSFAAFQLDGRGRLVASLSVDYPREVRRSLKVMGQVVQREALADPEVDLRTLGGG